MFCTRCGGGNCSRSHRRKAEFVLATVGVFPWRCLDCHARFYARRVPLRRLFYAHCGRCGNLELVSIRPERLDSGFAGRLATWLGARPLRCDFCRLNFVSWLPIWSAEEKAAEEQTDQNPVGARK